MTKWVSVDDNYKPYFKAKKHRPVIVTDGNTVTVAWYDHEKKTYIQDISFKDITDAVKHWCYLPNAYPHKRKKDKAINQEQI